MTNKISLESFINDSILKYNHEDSIEELTSNLINASNVLTQLMIVLYKKNILSLEDIEKIIDKNIKYPILHGDQIHDDTEAVQAYIDGEPVLVLP